MVAATLCLLQGLVLAGFIVFYLYEMGIGASDDMGRAGMSVVLFALFGLGLAALGRAWLRDLAWPRTPTILWNVLLLPVAWGLRGGGQFGLALTLGAAAVLAVVSGILAGSVVDGPTADHRAK